MDMDENGLTGPYGQIYGALPRNPPPKGRTKWSILVQKVQFVHFHLPFPKKSILIQYVFKKLSILMETLIPKHGGYQNLKTFQLAQLIYDITVRFCLKFIGMKSRTNDQMVQAARSGVQNIAEGSQASATSKKTELKLTNVARASLEELKLDYKDYLRQRKMMVWDYDDPRGRDLIAYRLKSADEFALWTKHQAKINDEEISQIAANGLLILLHVACTLLDRQIAAQAKAFLQEGGFTERLYRMRSKNRNLNS